ncbi:MAG TPA: hypothetical protein PL182_07810, partial [Pseudobdellovibrionaceae bacterium]|nr:hypothetical protein [Pseudobdellovibrionaceae bacterium]
MKVTQVSIWLLLLLMSNSGWAGSSGVTYHGRLLKPNGRTVTASNVQFRLQVRTPSPSNCLLFEEIHIEDLSSSQGVFSITLNDGHAAQINTEPFTLQRAFQNWGIFQFAPGKCAGTTDDYTPGSTDGRQLAVSFNDGSFAGWEPLPAQEINYVPLALESVSVQGHRPSNFFRVMDSEVLHIMNPWSSENYQKLLDLVANTTISGSSVSVGGTAAGFTGVLAGDVTGGQNSTKVERIQGNAVLAGTPSDQQVLTWNYAQSRWEAADLPAAGNPDWNDITNRPTSLPPSGSAGGDLAGSTYPNPVIANNAITVAKINDGAVAFSKIAPGSATGQVLQYEAGVGWKSGKLLYTDMIKAGGGSPWPTGPCGAGEAVVWQSATDGFECAPIAITESDPNVKAFAKVDPSSDFDLTGGNLALNTVPIARGGTGAVSQSAAINNLLPSQSGNTGKLL